MHKSPHPNALGGQDGDEVEHDHGNRTGDPAQHAHGVGERQHTGTWREQGQGSALGLWLLVPEPDLWCRPTTQHANRPPNSPTMAQKTWMVAV